MDNHITTITRSKTIPLANTYLDVQLTLEIAGRQEGSSNSCRKYRLLIREHDLKTQIAKGTLVNTEADATDENFVSTLKDGIEEMDTKILAVAKGKIFDAIEFLLSWITKVEGVFQTGGRNET